VTVRILIFASVMGLVSIVLHARLRTFLRACVWSAAIGGVINLLHELASNEFQIRPSDAVFWLPQLFLIGGALSFAIAGITGLPFSICRRRSARLGNPGHDTRCN
jgi:hypothetical protein